jgi:hypothetical protein
MNQANLKAAGGFSAEAQEVFAAHEKQMLPLIVKSWRTKERTFSELCQFFANSRRVIAKKASSEEPELFGKLRKLESNLEVTDLAPSKDEALYTIYKNDFTNYLSTEATEHHCDFGKRVISKQYLGDYCQPTTSNGVLFKVSLSDRDSLEASSIATHVQKLYNRNSPLRFKYGPLCNEQRIGHITITNYVTCEGVDIETTSVRGLVEMSSSKDTSADVISKLSDCVYMLTHTPSENIDTLLGEAEKHWLEAKGCSVERDPSLFKSHIASMYWYFSHAMPYIRGSEAITKWLAELSAQLHGYTIAYSPDYVYRMPFGTKLDEFTDYFVKNADLRL